MKKALISFFHQPKKVAIISLIIALAIGFFSFINGNKPLAHQYVKAGPASIALTGTENGNVSLGFLAAGRIKTVAVKTGDQVKKGDVLATLDAQNGVGALTQAQALYATAQANYQKLLNGATDSSIQVAKTAVATAQVNLSEIQKQQDTLVANAYRNLLNSAFVAEPADDLTQQTTLQPPIISGTYSKNIEGSLIINFYPSNIGVAFSVSGIASEVGGKATKTITAPIADTGLYLLLPSTESRDYNGSTWRINIPNKATSNYLQNYNAYQSALETKNQTIAVAEAALDQAQAALNSVASTARPEDVASAKAQVDNAYGALLTAQGTYANTIITAPSDGTIAAVHISPGQIAAANAPAIELQTSTASKEVAVAVPVSAVISRAGSDYVMKRMTTGEREVKITTSAKDDTRVEILNGLSAGDEVVVY